jgi:DNA modification methylase
MTTIRLINADVLAGLGMLADESVQCCVTSPPYWGLRDYGVPGQIGLEPTIEEYVAKMVEVFREVRRVLRKDGVLFLNLGDSYSSGGRTSYDSDDKLPNRGHSFRPGAGHQRPQNGLNLKPKDLCGVPWRVALALQADGWYLRSDIIWAKPNPMPESCTDRPTTAHEHIFLLTKSAKYFYDAEAVREGFADSRNGNPGAYKWSYANDPETGKGIRGGGGPSTKLQSEGWNSDGAKSGRNLRSVWTIATAPFPSAHFATFPPAIPERCIKAGTSEKGCCPKCGAPWRRVVEKSGAVKNDNYENQKVNYTQYGGKASSTLSAIPAQSTTTGWAPTCTCPPAEPIPCTVLDPFSGAGTTGLVAAKLGRDAVLIELNPEYCEMARRRIKDDLGMLAEVVNG